MDNYFQFSNAASLPCYIEGFGPTFPILAIYVPTKEAGYYLVFQQPFYINAPMSWIGANFSLGDRNEREKIAKMITSTPERIADYRDQSMLFIAEVDQATPYPKRIEILALFGRKEEKRK